MINLSVYGSRVAIEDSITALANGWGVYIAWENFPGIGPHNLRFDTVRIDVRFITFDQSENEVITQVNGANIRITYHGIPSSDHLANISNMLVIYQDGVSVNGVTKIENVPEGWPQFF